MPEVISAQIIDGKAVAASVREQLKFKIEGIVKAGGRKPGLAVVLVGDNAASAVYVRNKIAACKQVGIESTLRQFPGETSTEEVLDYINKLNSTEEIDGILVQLPLPPQIPPKAILHAVHPDKDVDGLHPYNCGLLVEGLPGLRPCTPSGVMTLLEHYQVKLVGAHAVIVGRSNLVGKPLALMLLEKHATVTVCHSKSAGLEEICRTADLLVVAVGRPRMVHGSWIKPGATVIDVGINKHVDERGESQLVGDVDFAQACRVASLITPVPGGVGPMTIALLLSNTLTAYEANEQAKSEKETR